MPKARMLAAAPRRAMRADARANYERLLSAASVVFAEHGASAPLDDVARAAGTGNATLYRHFPTRDALIEAMLTSRYQALSASAIELSATLPPRAALLTWLGEFIEHLTAFRGLASIVMASQSSTAVSDACHSMRSAGEDLLQAAQNCSAVRDDLTISDVLKLANGVAVASEREPDQTSRLVSFVFEGLDDRTEPTG